MRTYTQKEVRNCGSVGFYDSGPQHHMQTKDKKKCLDMRGLTAIGFRWAHYTLTLHRRYSLSLLAMVCTFFISW